MGRKHLSGLVVRDEVWHIDKRICGRRICQSTGATDLVEAERYLARLMEQVRQATIYGVRPKRTFEQAAAKYVLEHQHKRSLRDDVGRLKNLMGWIGPLTLDQVHMGSLHPWIEHRRRQGVSNLTINQGLQLVRRIANLAAGEWMDEHGLTWLLAAPKIKLLPTHERRHPWPLSWAEQDRLFAELPPHLQRMALFAVHTGLRDGELCGLRWEWEIVVPQLATSVFVIPRAHVKNGDERLVVLNMVARSVLERQCGEHAEFVFCYEGRPIARALTSAWKRARLRAGLPQVRVHDLRHTFGRRLRAAGVSFEDRQDLLGHRSGRVTTHYSAAELSRLLDAANSICERDGRRPELVVLNGRFLAGSRKTPAKMNEPLRQRASPIKQAIDKAW